MKIHYTGATSNEDFDGLASMVAARKLFPRAKLVLRDGAREAVRNLLVVILAPPRERRSFS